MENTKLENLKNQITELEKRIKEKLKGGWKKEPKKYIEMAKKHLKELYRVTMMFGNSDLEDKMYKYHSEGIETALQIVDDFIKYYFR